MWLQGDNLGDSTDSRYYGPVPLALVQGVVFARVYASPGWIPRLMPPPGQEGGSSQRERMLAQLQQMEQQMEQQLQSSEVPAATVAGTDGAAEGVSGAVPGGGESAGGAVGGASAAVPRARRAVRGRNHGAAGAAAVLLSVIARRVAGVR